MNCPVCKSEQTKTVGPSLVECWSCQHIYQDPPIVSAKYDFNYVHKAYDNCPTRLQMAHLRLGFLRAFKSRGMLLDIGYGNGDFVRTAQRSGFHAYGFDIHGHNYGIPEVKDPLTNYWDVVTFFDSMEHFPDLSYVKQICNNAKMVMVSVPCVPKSFPKNLNWRHYKPGEHLHYFSPLSLRMVVNKTMLRETDLEDVIRVHPDHQNIFTAIYGETKSC
jgi:hypothetical protein